MTPDAPQHAAAASAPPPPDVNPPQRRTGLRWRFPVVVLILAIIGQVVATYVADDDYSMLSLYRAGVLMPAFVLLLGWWLFFSGVRWRTRLVGVGVLGVAAGVFLTLFRMNGQSGDFIPQFEYRFAPTAEQVALDYFESKPAGDAQPAGSSSGAAEPTERLEVTEADWPRFGGPLGDHIVHGETIRRDWESNPPKALWRHPVGPAWSSFAVVGDLAFTQEQRGENEAVVCYDANTGEQIWVHEDPERFYESASGTGPRSTPTIHDSRLYALGATGVLNCLDPLTGAKLWSTNVVKNAETELLEWGMAGSPTIYENLVIVNPGGPHGAVAAYDRLTGEQKWAGGHHKAAYATPLVAELDGVTQVLIYCSEGICGHDINSGEQLWFFPWTNLTRLNIVQPIVLPDKSVFISSGYGTGSALLKVSHSGEEWKVDPIWERPNQFKLKFNGGIYKDGYVYGLDEGILSCFDLKTGERKWKKGRYKFGQVVMVGGDLVVSTEAGDVVLVEATPEKATEIAQFKAIEGKTWNHPVLNRGRLFVRNAEEAACYDLRPQTETAQLQ
jgi:outer membrane protein assembly factor BamB